MRKIICWLFGHGWIYGKGFSTEKMHRVCVDCGKMECLE